MLKTNATCSDIRIRLNGTHQLIHELERRARRLAKAARNCQLYQPGVMRNARTATGDAAIAMLGYACELLHDFHTDAALDSRRPIFKAGGLRIRIW